MFLATHSFAWAAGAERVQPPGRALSLEPVTCPGCSHLLRAAAVPRRPLHSWVFTCASFYSYCALPFSQQAVWLSPSSPVALLLMHLQLDF